MSRQPHDADVTFRRDLLLTVQVALLGEISKNVRGVTVGWEGTQIQLRAIFDGPPNAEDAESMECVGTEVIAAFPSYEISVDVIRVDQPGPLEPHLLKAWVYRRKER